LISAVAPALQGAARALPAEARAAARQVAPRIPSIDSPPRFSQPFFQVQRGC
jgi:hypothetical protein